MTARKEGSGLCTARVWTMDTVRSNCTEDGDCLLWKGCIDVNGQPRASISGKATYVRAYVYKTLCGKVLNGGRRLSTSCGNPACLAEEHIVAMTPKAISQRWMKQYLQQPINRQRFVDAAHRSGNTKLNAELAEQIRQSSEPDEVVASRYGVDRSSIGKIRRGKSYAAPKVATSVFNFAGTL